MKALLLIMYTLGGYGSVTTQIMSTKEQCDVVAVAINRDYYVVEAKCFPYPDAGPVYEVPK